MASTFPTVRAVRVVVVGWHHAVSRAARRPHRRPRRCSGAATCARSSTQLRKEFEAVRDAYGARLAALEAKLTAIGAPAPDAPAAVAAAPPAAVPAEVQVPAGAAGSGGPSGALPVYGNASAMSKIFNPDIAVIGNFVGARRGELRQPEPGARARRSRGDLSGGRRSVCARRLLSGLLAGGRRDRRGLPDADVAARRAAGEGREARSSRSAR